MDKTPGDIVLEMLGEWDETAPRDRDEADEVYIDVCDGLASAVIAHVRPQIEAEYRKRYPTGFCDCACKIDEDGNTVLSMCNTHRDHVAQKEAGAWAAAMGDLEPRQEDAIRALAAAPPGFVCVPVEPTKAIIDAMLEPLTAHCFLTTEQRIVAAYKDMLAAARKS